jgi:hypothetical protein
MKVVRSDLPKLCHSQIGSIVQLINEDGSVQEEAYMICVYIEKGKIQRHPPNNMNGLYSVKYPLFLVNIETGEARDTIHLSKRVQPLPFAYTVLNEDKEKE